VGLFGGPGEAAAEVANSDPAKWRDRMERIKLLREWIVGNLEAARQNQARYYDAHRRERYFAVGDQVLKRQHVLSSVAQHVSAKLATKFHGPFVIWRILSPVVYELVDTGGNSVGKVHVKDLKPYTLPLPPAGIS
jgi:hypothetical protein